MAADDQAERRRRIEAAAFAVLAEKGYRAASMLQIAKRAKASNQTLYAWYGGKAELFESLIERDGAAVKGMLGEAAGGGETAPLAALEALGPLLLAFTAGDKAVVMNRAAIADAGETGVLGAAIDRVARLPMLALIEGLMARAAASGPLRADTDPAEAAEVYVALLFGEVPMRQAMGRLAPLTEAERQARAGRALALLLRLYGAGEG